MGNSSSHSNRGLFRDGTYHKTVTFGKRRVKDGECCAIWDSMGRVRNVVGPKREFIYWSDVRFLDRFVANQNEYLVVEYRDGRKEHVRGPVSLFCDPVLHKRVQVQEAISLNAFEAIVVYRELDRVEGLGIEHSAAQETPSALIKGGCGGGSSAVEIIPAAVAMPADGKRVSRRIIRGPTLFIPSASEWVHTFSWHGSNNKMDDHRTMIKDALKLTKIRTLPDQLYYNVVGCRTSDDAQLSIKLMMLFQMSDLEKMLDSTHDPIGDFVNALSADVISFVASLTFEEFIRRSSELNNLAAFPVLQERAASIGYKVDKLVYRGYKASDQLQQMHDSAIRTRTTLQLEAKTAEQQQSIEDLKLGRKLERGKQEREMERATRSHALELNALEHAERLRQADAERQASAEAQKVADAQRVAFLDALGAKGVDLTKYLCALERKHEKTICIETLGSGGGGGSGRSGDDAAMVPHIHLGDSSLGNV